MSFARQKEQREFSHHAFSKSRAVLDRLHAVGIHTLLTEPLAEGADWSFAWTFRLLASVVA